MNGFMGGYVYGPNMPVGGVNIKRPFKDEIHDHTMRCVEYTIQQFATERLAEKALEASVKHAAARQKIEQELALKEAQRDTHPQDGAREGRIQIGVRGRRTFY
jgi:hypothetical protein